MEAFYALSCIVSNIIALIINETCQPTSCLKEFLRFQGDILQSSGSLQNGENVGDVVMKCLAILRDYKPSNGHEKNFHRIRFIDLAGSDLHHPRDHTSTLNMHKCLVHILFYLCGKYTAHRGLWLWNNWKRSQSRYIALRNIIEHLH